MKVIYKYPFPLQDEITIQLPCHSKALSIQLQNNQLCLWALVDTTLPQGTMTILVRVDHECNIYGNARYISTIQMDNYAFHFFVKEN